MSFDQNKPAANSSLVSGDMRNNFTHLKGAISKEHSWDDTNPNASSHRLDQISATVATGSVQVDLLPGVYDYTTGGGNITTYIDHYTDGIPAGTYTLQSLLQELVKRSHRHTREQHLTNCNCNCTGGA